MSRLSQGAEPPALEAADPPSPAARRVVGQHTQASRHLCFPAHLETDRWGHLRTSHGPQGRV